MKTTREPAIARFRLAERADGPALLGMIEALAQFERLEPPDEPARTRLLEDAFGTSPRFAPWLAFIDEEPEPVGYAILVETYSSFLAQPTLYLEDLFVLPEFRGRGIGRSFLAHCARLAYERGCGRMEWTCLTWNTRAQTLYEGQLGAERLNDWLLYRLTRPAMERLLGQRGAADER